jgi:FkbM family methyltransferase
MHLTDASGRVWDLDFEPLRALAVDPRYFVPTILDEINRGVYAGMVRPGATVIDLGANIGLFSLYAAGAAQVVYAVEPTPEHVAVLRQILSRFEIRNVVPIEAAIWTRDGRLRFYRDAANTTMNRVDFGAECFGRPAAGDLEVQCLALDTLLARHGLDQVDLVKIDIEGAELDLVTSPAFARAAPRIAAVYCECHNFKDWGDGHQVALDCRAALEPLFPVIDGFWDRGFLASREPGRFA